MKIHAQLNGKEIKNPLARFGIGLLGATVATLLIVFVALPLVGIAAGVVIIGGLTFFIARPIALAFGKKRKNHKISGPVSEMKNVTNPGSAPLPSSKINPNEDITKDSIDI